MDPERCPTDGRTSHSGPKWMRSHAPLMFKKRKNYRIEAKDKETICRKTQNKQTASYKQSPKNGP